MEKVAACRSLVAFSAVVDGDSTGLLNAHLKGHRFERNPGVDNSAPGASRAVAVKRRSSGPPGHAKRCRREGKQDQGMPEGG